MKSDLEKVKTTDKTNKGKTFRKMEQDLKKAEERVKDLLVTIDSKNCKIIELENSSKRLKSLNDNLNSITESDKNVKKVATNPPEKKKVKITLQK